MVYMFVFPRFCFPQLLGLLGMILRNIDCLTWHQLIPRRWPTTGVMLMSQEYPRYRKERLVDWTTSAKEDHAWLIFLALWNHSRVHTTFLFGKREKWQSPSK